MTPLDLSDELAEKARTFPESSYGATKVTLVLWDGTRIPDVVLAWARQIVRVGSRAVDSPDELGFGIANVRDVLAD